MLTRAADEGASAEKLAELADHSDLQNVMVYIDNSPSYVVRLGERIDSYYEPALKRFRGTITLSDNGTGNAIPGFSPHLPLLDLGGIGRCGAEGICNLAPPVSCYHCDHFIAFRDGPHRDVVRALEQSMEGMSPRMGLQLAPTLAAARDLVRQLDEEQAVTSHDEDGDYA